jgi:3-oxoacyl-[acyl-carrier-protein] synthase III
VKAGRTQMRRAAGNYPASVNEENWPHLFERLCVENNFTPDDLDQLLFTQISKPSIAIETKRYNVPLEKCNTAMGKCGYTGSACIPMALDDAIDLGKIKRGDLVVMLASGLGLNQTGGCRSYDCLARPCTYKTRSDFRFNQKATELPRRSK